MQKTGGPILWRVFVQVAFWESLSLHVR